MREPLRSSVTIGKTVSLGVGKPAPRDTFMTGDELYPSGSQGRGQRTPGRGDVVSGELDQGPTVVLGLGAPIDDARRINSGFRSSRWTGRTLPSVSRAAMRCTADLPT